MVLAASQNALRQYPNRFVRLPSTVFYYAPNRERRITVLHFVANQMDVFVYSYFLFSSLQPLPPDLLFSSLPMLASRIPPIPL